jgi:hypothetical protein
VELAALGAGGAGFGLRDREGAGGARDSRQGFEQITDDRGERGVALGGPDPRAEVDVVGDGYGNVAHEFSVR